MLFQEYWQKNIQGNVELTESVDNVTTSGPNGENFSSNLHFF